MRGGVPSKKGGVRNNLGGVHNNAPRHALLAQRLVAQPRRAAAAPAQRGRRQRVHALALRRVGLSPRQRVSRLDAGGAAAVGRALGLRQAAGRRGWLSGAGIDR